MRPSIFRCWGGLALEDGLEAAASFLDVSKAYEGVNHVTLAIEVVRRGFPPVLAQMAVAAYKGERRVRVDGCVAPEGARPRRGIIAGCALAVTMMGIYMLPVIEAARGPGVQMIRDYVSQGSWPRALGGRLKRSGGSSSISRLASSMPWPPRGLLGARSGTKESARWALPHETWGRTSRSPSGNTRPSTRGM